MVIVGGGPIGASSAYFLSQKLKNIVLLTAEPDDQSAATYHQAGGSIRWAWDDPLKRDLTTQTAEFIQGLLRQGVDLSAIENTYHFAKRGRTIPALNINVAKLVGYFLAEAERQGVEIVRNVRLIRLEEHVPIRLETSAGTIEARQAVVAVGAALPTILPDAPVHFAKRVLLVLDVPIGAEGRQRPHTIIPFRSGVVYTFVKRIGEEYKLLLGQEGVVGRSDRWGPNDFLSALLYLGVTEAIPPLKNARVEKILWGFDATKKTPVYYQARPNLLAVTCGSAVRSCVGIGREVAERVRAGQVS